jgi:hypothetical protein
MATAKEIERVILKVAGNPSAGAIKSLAPVWAEEIAKLDEPKVKRATVAPEETR